MNDQVLEVNLKVKLRKGTREHFLTGSKPVYGSIFYLSRDAENFDGPYSLRADHVDSGDFKAWIEQGRVWVKDWKS